ncbi:sensor histidine kinase [Cytobacillus purgationiresistens]|uniref:histidine kinase n=1 Tax=Cytobacillus purgationiresistens TaxID=863449 RepID=A0ABU0ASR4_9BACI|nr:sensor histidine kinase [Cytobacillus purgationiresistens]MDQ0273816.1 signal transduction histidine kinase [Cytobacillus purgationiresistens]
MKKTYFIWLAIQCVVWTFAFFQLPPELNERRLTSMSIFFIILFLLPLLTEKPLIQTILFCIQALITIIIFYPIDNVLNPYVILIQSLIIAEAVFYLSRLKSLIVIGVQLGAAAAIVLASTLTASQLAWCGLYYLLLVIALLHYQVIYKQEKAQRINNDTLLDEYRRMKRQLITEEEQARQDERMLIGHEIHDSVGHKLTALLLQFEAFRLTADEKDKVMIGNLKELAEQSLDETRQAVKSFKQREVGGLQGVIRLIRKLEMESFMKVNFSVKHGAFAAPLTGEQSFAIYRAVQEALTNIMKHSTTREAQVIFETPGGSIFRFEVINLTTPAPFFQEGYGLKAMRERLEKVGGLLEIDYDKQQFVVRGIIRLTDRSG